MPSISDPVFSAPGPGQLFRDRLADAQLFLCTDSRRDQGDFAGFVEAAYAGGVDIIQLRDKNIEAAEELECCEVLRAAAERHGKLFSVNDRVDICALAGAPALHLGQADVPIAAARQLLGPEPVIGLSSHTPAQVASAATMQGVDYFCTGPVWATPTKPGRKSVGLDLVRHAAALAGEGPARPWFAIGGIDHSNVEQVVDAGASRIVVVRAITTATDPQAAARSLRDSLPPLG